MGFGGNSSGREPGSPVESLEDKRKEAFFKAGLRRNFGPFVRLNTSITSIVLILEQLNRKFNMQRE